MKLLITNSYGNFLQFWNGIHVNALTPERITNRLVAQMQYSFSVCVCARAQTLAEATSIALNDVISPRYDIIYVVRFFVAPSRRIQLETEATMQNGKGCFLGPQSSLTVKTIFDLMHFKSSRSTRHFHDQRTKTGARLHEFNKNKICSGKSHPVQIVVCE